MTKRATKSVATKSVETPAVHPMSRPASPPLLKQALFRETPEAEPVSVEVLSRKRGKVVLRELGKPLSGVWAAREDQIAPPLRVDAHDFAVWLNINLRRMGLVQ